MTAGQETYTWHPIAQCVPELEEHPYVSFSDPSRFRDVPPPCPSLSGDSDDSDGPVDDVVRGDALPQEVLSEILIIGDIQDGTVWTLSADVSSISHGSQTIPPSHTLLVFSSRSTGKSPLCRHFHLLLTNLGFLSPSKC